MNDYYPTINTTTHQLERAPTWATRQEVSNEFCSLYDIEFSTRHIVNRMSTEILARATSLYSYTRFEDESLVVKYPVWNIRHEHRLATPKDHIKRWLFIQWEKLRSRNQRWNREHAARCGDKLYKNRFPEFPKRFKPKWEFLQLVDRQNESKNIERVQESLLAQIALFYEYDIKPQAVLAHPSMASQLAAARTMDNRYHQVACSINGQSMFAGLPVIACSELAQGAMVV